MWPLVRGDHQGVPKQSLGGPYLTTPHCQEQKEAVTRQIIMMLHGPALGGTDLVEK
jgi:hypothetical protein